MNHKRKKSKRNVKCTLCTPHRWKGNSSERFKAKEVALVKASEKEMKEVKLNYE
jgi:hypothetical protein